MRAVWVVGTFILTTLVVGFCWSLLESVFPFTYSTAAQDDPGLLFVTLGNFISALSATLICRLVFGAPVGLVTPLAGRGFLVGATLGTALLAVSVGAQVISGHGTLTWAGLSLGATLMAGLQHLVVIGLTSVAEEFLIRGVAFRALLKVWPAWVVVVLSGLIFGAMHLFNPHSTLQAAVGISLVGFWFGLLVVKTNTLATGIGLHLAWNFAEGFIFGQPVSGIAPGVSVFTATWSPEVSFFSGGDFGPELSGVTLLLLTGGVVFSVLMKPWPEKESAESDTSEALSH